MRARLRCSVPWMGLLVAILILGFASAPWAQVAKQGNSDLDNIAFAKSELATTIQGEDLNVLRARSERAGTALQAIFEGYDRFLAESGGTWRMVFDRVTGRPMLVEGSGLPWIPGTANHLKGQDLGLRGEVLGKDVPASVVARRAARFIKDHPGLFGVDVADLALNEAGSGPVGDYLYFVDFSVTRGVVPVEGAHVFFRMNHGNLVQFGQEKLGPALGDLDTRPAISVETAWQIVGGYIGGIHPSDEVFEAGRLAILPVSDAQALSGAAVEPGSGVKYRLAYVMSFHRPTVMGTWEARVDAQTGEVLSFLDVNEYGNVHGGSYAGDRPAPEVNVPFPFADVGGGLYANAGGLYDGNVATSKLAGKYVKIVDVGCGPGNLYADIANSTDWGNLDFGMGGGTDCQTPGFGGAGNTHAARTQYYQVNLIKMKAQMYLPANTWLQGQLVDNVNLNRTCNAYWNGVFLNFFKSGGGCGNTGELPGVSLHEWGHGMDSNDGSSPTLENGTGETYGDFTAVLQTHSSCTGNGFFLSGNCSGYGDTCTNCSGIRDVDYAKHVRNTPATVENFTRTTCPLSSTSNPNYVGPCGKDAIAREGTSSPNRREGHCESYVSSEALWDLAARKLTAAPYSMDQPTAWQTVDRLWYLSRSAANGAFTCSTVAVPWTSTGCNAGSNYSVFRLVDDDDGNLTNGTPHAAAIFAAFNDHGIACGAAGDATNQDSSSCPPIGAPTLYGAPGDNQNTLTWSGVATAANYLIYRNELSCSAGYMQIGSVSAPANGFSDPTAVNGMTYYYRLQAIGTSSACFGPMSNCVTLAPVPAEAGAISGTVKSTLGGSPVAGATVRATSGPNIFQTTTDGSGAYSITSMPVGTYGVTAGAYNFASTTVASVPVNDGATTSLSLTLSPLGTHVVSGTVIDAAYGWPLYASIAITGPGFASTTIWTDPATGFYSTPLAGGTSYTFTANAYAQGYMPTTLTVVVPPSADLSQDIVILRDPIVCSAPGYAAGSSTTLLSESFDAVTPAPNPGPGPLPAGWAVQVVRDTHASTPGALTPNWATYKGRRYPASSSGAHSAPNIVYFNAYDAAYGDSARLYQTTTLDLSAVADPAVFFWVYHSTSSATLFPENVQVQASTDGGTTWQNVGVPVYRYDGSSGWKRHGFVLQGIAGDLTQVQIGFLATSDFGPQDLNLDDISVTALTCTAPPGGLVVGHVYDLPTHTALGGATVANATTGGSVSADSNGYYTIFASSGGDNSLTATKAGGVGIGWGSDAATLSVTPGQTLSHDFTISANHLTPTPATLTMAVVQGTTRTGTLTLSNDGNNGSTSFGVKDWPGSFSPASAAPPAASLEEVLASARSVPASSAVDPEPCDSGLDVSDRRTEAAPWTNIAQLPAINQDGAAAAYGGKVYLAGGLISGTTRTDAFRVYDPAGNTWTALTSLPAPRSLASAVVIGSTFYLMGGSTGTTDNAVLTTDLSVTPNVWTAGPTMPLARNSGGAVVLEGKIYFMGGRDNTGTPYQPNVYVFDPGAGTWSTGTPLPAGLIYPSVCVIQGKIYAAGGITGTSSASTYSAKTYVFDPCKNSWSTVADMPGAIWGATYGASDDKFYVAAGAIGGSIYSPCPAFVYNPMTNVWSQIANTNNVLYRGASACGLYRIGGSNGSTAQNVAEVYPGLTNCTSVDAAWLSESPTSGTLDQSSDRAVAITCDATSASLGTYTGVVEVCQNTPYANSRVPVTMRVVPPISITISGTPNPSVAGTSVAFGCVVTGGTGAYTGYAWNFGDSSTGTGAAPHHTYASWGAYTVTLTVTDDGGLTGAKTYTQTVKPVPPVIGGIQAVSPPDAPGFQLTISGGNFHSNCTVKINGTAVPATVVKSTVKVVAKGSGLKSMVPKNQTVQVTVTNNDDGGVSAPFAYTR